jgi:acetyltransferase-like isoleucine patch superfamily enzyme
MRKFSSHGDGHFIPSSFATLGDGVVFEEGVRVWHPETIHLGSNVYLGHDAMLKGYYKGQITIGDNTWIGQGVFMHAAGDIVIGHSVGIGPYVKILTSSHEIPEDQKTPILAAPLTFSPVTIGDGADIGVGAIILPGVTVGDGAQVGAGAVVTQDVSPYSIVAGNPARVLRVRTP